MSEKKDQKIQILVAVIGFVGVILAAVISNLDKFSSDDSKYEKKDATEINKIVSAKKNIQAELISIKTFDDDTEQKCNTKGSIHLRETYKVSNTDIKGITITHNSNTGLYTYKKEYKVQGTANHLVFEYCVQKKYESDVQTKFMNLLGESSNTVKFHINTKTIKIQDPATRLPLVKII